jgi:hypothetical protein
LKERIMNDTLRKITREDVLEAAAGYAAVRDRRRKEIVAIKRARRVSVGPYATFYFENYDTMFQQILEMLHIEKGGEEQIADELAAYNPMIPQGRELTATLMFEIPDPVQRARILALLGGVEDQIFIEIDGSRIKAVSEADVERTKADGKTSSVHFLHFPLTDEQAADFKTGRGRVLLAIEHPDYGHIAVMSDEARSALARDLA